MRVKRSVLLALTDTHHGFFKGTARYARVHQWHVVADMIYTAKLPVGWRGDPLEAPRRRGGVRRFAVTGIRR